MKALLVLESEGAGELFIEGDVCLRGGGAGGEDEAGEVENEGARVDLLLGSRQWRALVPAVLGGSQEIGSSQSRLIVSFPSVRLARGGIRSLRTRLSMREYRSNLRQYRKGSHRSLRSGEGTARSTDKRHDRIHRAQ